MNISFQIILVNVKEHRFHFLISKQKHLIFKKCPNLIDSLFHVYLVISVYTTNCARVSGCSGLLRSASIIQDEVWCTLNSHMHIIPVRPKEKISLLQRRCTQPRKNAHPKLNGLVNVCWLQLFSVTTLTQMKSEILIIYYKQVTSCL